MLRTIVHGVCVAVGGFGMALFLFLLLPFVQAITEPPSKDLELRTVDTADVPPPPPPPEEEEEEKPSEPDEVKPPELTDAAPPLDLSQLELALNPGMGGGDGMAGDFAVKLPSYRRAVLPVRPRSKAARHLPTGSRLGCRVAQEGAGYRAHSLRSGHRRSRGRTARPEVHRPHL